MIALPTIALEMPPPDSPNSAVGVVRKCRLSAPTPLSRTEPTTISRTATASRAATVEATSTIALNAFATLQVAAIEQQRVARGRVHRASASVGVTSTSFSEPRWTMTRATTLTRTAKTSRIRPR